MANEQVIVEDEDSKYLPKNPWSAVGPILLAVFIYVMDGTIANVALPHMAGSFSATRDESMWILTSYLIASGIVIPSVDFFSKLLGRKNFFVISILVFTIASLLCGLVVVVLSQFLRLLLWKVFQKNKEEKGWQFLEWELS